MKKKLQAHLQRLYAENDGTLTYQRAIVMLQSVLVSTPPDKTVLLANYPNPFNPETWIPYRLAKAANVQIPIYNAHGTVVRHLELGYQSAGYYISRNRAAYWDGKNDFGERVANGIYFYQLQADAVSPLRKMVILK
ncbi:MAG: T9SS type A sorting domain-containing protein [Candidatus Poribacteria bacterium]|nr:T9SS type A sorting domain-containing protein [Candidatus Poribacteria bacterium]